MHNFYYLTPLTQQTHTNNAQTHVHTYTHTHTHTYIHTINTRPLKTNYNKQKASEFANHDIFQNISNLICYFLVGGGGLELLDNSLHFSTFYKCDHCII